MKIRRLTAALALTAAPVGLAACDSSSSAGSVSPSSARATAASVALGSTAPFGAGCAAVPASGSGSLAGMTTDPVAAAAGHNPVLSTLVTAVRTADLVDSLNTTPDLTVLAPANAGFDKIPAATLQADFSDRTLLRKIVMFHVIPGRLSPAQLAGTHKTLEGEDITIEGSGDSFVVGPSRANVICGNVQTANATVYILDGVLTPPAA